MTSFDSFLCGHKKYISRQKQQLSNQEMNVQTTPKYY